MTDKKTNKLSANIVTHYVEVPYYQDKRRIRVLLPDGYDTQEALTRTYPVLYLHDGQNVFYDQESFSGHSWRVIETIKQHPQLDNMLVIAIDNADERRLDEYGPWPMSNRFAIDFKEAGGDGMAYAQWLVETLKPFIDKHYRTHLDSQSTFLAGSSMGGLITAYVGAQYPEVFGCLGIFSLASWFSEQAFLSFISTHPLKTETRVFIQVGTNEGDAESEFSLKQLPINQTYINSTLHYYQSLLRAGHPIEQIDLALVAGAIHHEKHWADHLLDFLKFANE